MTGALNQSGELKPPRRPNGHVLRMYINLWTVGLATNACKKIATSPQYISASTLYVHPLLQLPPQLASAYRQLVVRKGMLSHASSPAAVPPHFLQ